jgi:ABC-2 family transporter protein
MRSSEGSASQAVENGQVESQRANQAPADAGGMIAGAAPTPKAVALVLLPALVLMLAFAFSYVGAFHDPTPHNVPLAVVGPASVATQLNQLPGDPLDTREAPSRSDALSQIDDRKVYGAYDASTNRLFVASAANRATAIALERTFSRISAAQNRPAPRVTDVKPLPPKDPNGTAAFYAVIAWVFGGYFGSTLIGLIGTPRSRSHSRGAARIGALAGFGLVAGILSVIVLRACFGVFAGHVVAMCAIAALTIFASGAATAGIQAAAGPAGTALVILLFVILGNAASGGPFARPLLPGLWRTIGGVLPPGASVDLARAALFFDGARIAGPILVLVGWAVLGAALVIALGGRVMSMVEAETEAAAGAAV